MRGFTKLISAVVLSVGAFFAINAVMSTSYAYDTSPNAVIYGGVSDISSLRNKFNNNTTAGTQNIFTYMVNKSNSWNGTSMSASDMVNNANYKSGYVTKTGTVVVDGEVVADGALSSGRQSIGSSTQVTYNGTTFYTRAPSVSFVSSQISAIVFFDSQGRFIAAVLNDCGNIVIGKNKIVPPTPVYACDKLAVETISRTERKYTTSYTANGGATIKDFVYTYGDGASATVTTASVNHTYAQPGTYTVSVTPRFTVNGQTVSAPANAACTATVTIEKPPVVTHPAVEINKTVDNLENKQVEVGKPFEYELVVKNTGDVDLTNVVVSDAAPAGVTFLSTDKGTITSNKLSYTIASLKVGASETIKLQAKVGAYQAGTIVNTACVNAKEVTDGANGQDDCDDAKITVVEPKVEVCEISSATIISVPQSQANDPKYAPKDSDKCKMIKVCEISSGTIVTVTKDKASDASKYADENSDKCKKCPVPGKENLTLDNPDCKTVPPTTVLPTTGITEVISSVVGLGALTAASYYYLVSRRP